MPHCLRCRDAAVYALRYADAAALMPAATTFAATMPYRTMRALRDAYAL